MDEDHISVAFAADFQRLSGADGDDIYLAVELFFKRGEYSSQETGISGAGGGGETQGT